MQLLRVLVVDDNKEFREGIAEVLADQGVEVSLAGDGEDALSILAADPPPHLVLLDLWMPKRDGWAVLAQLRADDRLSGVRVIVLTAVDVEGLAVPVLRKPFSVAKLLELLATVMTEQAQPGSPG